MSILFQKKTNNQGKMQTSFRCCCCYNFFSISAKTHPHPHTRPQGISAKNLSSWIKFAVYGFVDHQEFIITRPTRERENSVDAWGCMEIYLFRFFLSFSFLLYLQPNILYILYLCKCHNSSSNVYIIIHHLSCFTLFIKHFFFVCACVVVQWQHFQMEFNSVIVSVCVWLIRIK